jgi:hypothetical protein
MTCDVPVRFPLYSVLAFQRSQQAVFSPRSGGDEGTRTPDFCLAKAALSQLSYIPILAANGQQLAATEWAFQDSNLRPFPYQRNALTD